MLFQLETEHSDKELYRIIAQQVSGANDIILTADW